MTVEVSCDALSLFRLVRHRGVSSPEQDPQWPCSPALRMSHSLAPKDAVHLPQCACSMKSLAKRESELSAQRVDVSELFLARTMQDASCMCVFFFCDFFFFFAHGGWRLAFAAAEGRRNHFLLGKVSCGCCCCRWPGCLLSRQKLRAVLFA